MASTPSISSLVFVCFLLSSVKLEELHARNDTESSIATVKPPVECHYGGKTYKEGEEITTEKVCLHCVCHKGWTEPSTTECAIIDCPWHYYYKKPYCTQQYVDGKCCPELSCSPPPPKMDPSYLSRKRSTLSTNNYIIVASPGSEVMIYCVISNPSNETVSVHWTKMTSSGEEIPLFEISTKAINDSYDNSAWGLMLEAVEENDTGVYTCHIATDPPQTQKTELRVTSRPSFRSPQCFIPPTQKETVHRICPLNVSAWGYYYDEKNFDCVKHEPRCGDPPANNFATREECWDNCNDACYNSLEHGECDVRVERYHYDHFHDSCDSFTYNGCKGNRNNFHTKSECLSKCSEVRFLHLESKESEVPDEDEAELQQHCTRGCSWRHWLHYQVIGCRPILEQRSCCPTRFDCSSAAKEQPHNETEEITSKGEFRCFHEGKNYTLGEDIVLDHDCQVCTCTRQFKGPGGPGCRPVKECNLKEIQDKMAEGCVPVYEENKCCPISWQCPLKNVPYRQKGPELFYKEPSELQCRYGGREYPRFYSLITERGICRSCICLTPPHFTCVDTVCPPHPATLNETVRCEIVADGTCCPDYSCWDIRDKPNEEGIPQTEAEIEFCNLNPCPYDDVCRVNHTACYLGHCQRSCKKCPTPMCLERFVNEPFECPTCGLFRTPEEACRRNPCKNNLVCVVDEEKCRSGDCKPVCREELLLLLAHQIQYINDTTSCTNIFCPEHCTPTPPNEQGCSASCICPEALPKEGCKCPEGSTCFSDCDINGHCAPVCQVQESKSVTDVNLPVDLGGI